MTDKPHNPETGETWVRPFADWLRELAGGRTHDEMSDAIHTLVEAVKDTGRRGTLTVTFAVKPLTPGQTGGPFVVTDEIKLRPPEHDRPVSVFYADRNGNLTSEDPRQLTFDSLREVPPPPIRDDPATDEPHTQEGKA